MVFHVNDHFYKGISYAKNLLRLDGHVHKSDSTQYKFAG